MEQLGIEVDEQVRFGAFLGDKYKVACQGACRSLQVDLGACQIELLYVCSI